MRSSPPPTTPVVPSRSARACSLGGTADPATLLVVLDPMSRSQLCGRTAATLGNTVAVVNGSEQGRPVKLTVRDQASGVLVQAVIPAGWCVP